MDWETLFDDLQSRLEAAERDELDIELGGLIESELASTTLIERLRAVVGNVVRVALTGGDIVEGRVADCGDGWVLLTQGERQILLPLGAVSWIGPLGGSAPPPGLIASRLGLAYALRALARSRVPVRVMVVGARDVRGTIGRVGSDHLDVVLDARTMNVVTVGFSTLMAVTTV